MRYQHFIAAFVILTILVGAYFLGRFQATPTIGASIPTQSALNPNVETAGASKAVARTQPTAKGPAGPLPPRDAPLKDVFSELESRADAGDVAAATRLYRDLGLCRRFQEMDQANSRLADELLTDQVDASDPQQLENYTVQLDAIESRKRNMDRLRTLCDGATGAMLDSFIPNLREAAQLGEDNARACYLARGPSYDARGLVSHPEWLNAYRDSISSLIDSGVAAGDWKVVDLLRSAYEPNSQSPLAGVLGSDPYQYYRYLKLYRLGAESYRVNQIEQLLSGAAAHLTSTQLADADAWAQTTFERNFNGGNSTESTVEGWDPCSFPYE